MDLSNPKTFGDVTMHSVTRNGRTLRLQVAAKATFWDSEKRRLSLVVHKLSNIQPIADAVTTVREFYEDEDGSLKFYSPLSFWKELPCLKVKLGDKDEDGARYLKKNVVLDVEFNSWANDGSAGLQLVTYKVSPESPPPPPESMG